MASKNENHLFNNISPRDFKYIRCTERDSVVCSYADSIAKRLNINSYNIKKVFETMYGGYWYEQPYNKLYRLAKLAPKEEYETKRNYLQSYVAFRPTLPERIERKKSEIEDNYIVRYCRKNFGVKATNRRVDEYREFGYQTIKRNLSRIVKLSVVMGKEDKQNFDAVKNMFFSEKREQHYVADLLVDFIADFYKEGSLTDVIGLEKTKTIVGLYINSVARNYKDDDLACVYNMIEPAVEDMKRAYKSLCSPYVMEHYRESYTRIFAKRVKKVLAINKFIDDYCTIKKHGVKIFAGNTRDLRGYSRGKVNHQVMKLVGMLAKQDNIDEASARVLCEMSKVICDDNNGKNVYTPIFCYDLEVLNKANKESEEE